MIDVVLYLNKVAKIINDEGKYIKSNSLEGIPTWKEALNYTEEVDNTYKEFVDNAIEWIKNLKANNRYEENLKELFTLDDIKETNLSMLASLIPTYKRHLNILERQERIKAENELLSESSNYIGKLGDKISIKVADTKVASFDGYYGLTFLYQFIGDDGNVYVWKTVSVIDEPEEIQGIVKDHKLYNGIKETVLTRVKQIV